MNQRFKTATSDEKPNSIEKTPERSETAKSRDSSAGFRSRLTLLLRAFRHRNYRFFFSGQVISLTGTWMQTLAQSWLVYRLTGSSMALGLVGFTSQIPIFLFATIGGAVADRYSRHRIIVATQTISMILAFILAGLTLSGRVQIWHVYVLAALLGTVNAFDIPARQAFVVDMVGREDLINAVALNSSVFNSARIIGPAIAGVLVASLGEGWCFFANAVSYIGVITGLLMMEVQTQKHVQMAGSALSGVVDGFGYVGRTRPVRALLILLGCVSLMGMPYAVLMPIFADQILHGGARGLGLLMGASGVGAVIGAIRLAMHPDANDLGHVVTYAAMGFGASLILFSLSRSFWLSVALLIPVGFCMIVETASSNTLIQTMTPGLLRGRVMAVHAMMFTGMAPFGALLAGTLAHHLGAPVTLVIGGVVCIIAGAGFGLRLPPFRYDADHVLIALRRAGGNPADETTGDGSIHAAR